MKKDIRSATKEELEAQRQSMGKNYAPGSRQARMIPNPRSRAMSSPEMGSERVNNLVADAPACECGECFFRATINLNGKWVCSHHAPAEAAYLRKYGKPYRAAPPEKEKP